MCEQKLSWANTGTHQLYVCDLAVSKFLQLAYCFVRHRETYASHVLMLVIHTDGVDLKDSQKNVISIIYLRTYVYMYNLIKMQAHFRLKKKIK